MKILMTKNYRLFDRHEGENRPLDLKKHRKLWASMEKYGFLPCYPIVCYRNSEGKLFVKDGQHRIVIAEKLELAIYWVETDIDFDVAIVNSAGKNWTLRDYAEKHAYNGLKAYQEGLEFADNHRLPIGTAFALLAGTTVFSNTQTAFIDGTFKVKDRPWADAVAAIYTPFTLMSTAVRNSRFVEACMAVCRVEGFDLKRLVASGERCRDKLLSYSTRDAYLDMMEDIYNYGRKQLVGLKAAATMAMRERAVAKPAKNGKAKKEPVA